MLPTIDTSDQHWCFRAAHEAITRFPNAAIYTCAAGISPSGIVHFGNFRDVMTAYMVMGALRQLGKKTRLLFSWDEYDRFRKVPVGVPESFNEFIGKPLTDVPDPLDEFPSYARRFEKEFEESMLELGIELDYRYQTREYTSGRYVEEILGALRSRREIADVLLSFMSDKGKNEKSIDPTQYREEFFPISVYSRFTGKDATKVLDFDGDATITYRCAITKETESLNLRRDFCVKLAWKIDWPMRWGAEEVCFEPGGRDHATPGGSYDVSRVIAERVFRRPAPVFLGYEFIGLQGLDGKMSGSKGQAVSPKKLLDIYQPELLKWLYTRKEPLQGFNLAFDSEILRQYDEFDRECQEYREGKLGEGRRIDLQLAVSQDPATSEKAPLPFKQAVALGQTVQWNPAKIGELARGLGLDCDERSIQVRALKAQSWLETYNPSEVIRLLSSPNTGFAATLSPEQRARVRTLRATLETDISSIQSLEELVYGIPKDPSLSQKENSPRQRAFFKDVYQLLIGSETGPRLATFLWAVDRAQVLMLLSVVDQ